MTRIGMGRMAGACVAAAVWLASIYGAAAEPRHGIAMHGETAYPPGFAHFSYVNPKAPKGGAVRFAAVGSFDSLNPLIVKGTPAVGIREHVFESLMARSYDEPFSLYGLLAETVEVPDDRSWVAFRLRSGARFSDGRRVTVDDVIFSMETLRDKGRPNHNYYYSKVAKIERPDERTVKFVFGPDGDREMPLIMGLMPILPKHHYANVDFDKTTLEPPVGSGPYTVADADPGARIVYRRNPDYWGRYLAVNAGRNNFDTLTYDYYRDANASFEAFKAGLYDVRPEDDPTRWSVAYDFPAMKDGRVRKAAFDKGTPSGMRALVFNTRRDLFADRRVRHALGLLLDFEWVNQHLYYGAYVRTQSFFDGSELSSHGRPADAREQALLAPFPDAVSPDIMAEGWVAPKGDASGRNRANRRKAVEFMAEAGWEVRHGAMVHARTEAPFTFEILAASPSDERLALNYARALGTVGIVAKVRTVDSSQYQQRRQTYDFDMIFNFWFASLSPGNEQSFYWGSAAADTDGTRNYMGAKNPAVDAMIAALLEARTREEFVAAVRALDRVLLSGHYVVPLFHQPDQWVAAWSRVRWPARTSLYGYRADTWWIEATN